MAGKRHRRSKKKCRYGRKLTGRHGCRKHPPKKKSRRKSRR